MTFDVSLSNKSYEMHNVDKRVLHQVDEALYPYDPTWKRVGVNVSGGADSAVGTAILAELIEKHGNNTEIVFLTNVRVWNNRPWAGPISVEVYEKICSMFPDVKMQRVQNFIPPELEEGSIGIIEQIGTTGDRMCTQSFNRFAVHTYKLDAVYNFITNNPSNDEVAHSKGPWDRLWNEEKLADTSVCPQYFSDTPVIVHPWKLIKKDFIMGQYYRRGWQNLLDTTRSCEGDINLFPDGPFIDYTRYEHGVTPLHECHEIVDDIEKGCYWCAEREWAKQKAQETINAT
jgi:hypothetical protein